MSGRQMDHGQKIGGVLLKASSNSSKLLELVDGAFNDVSLPIDFLVKPIDIVSAFLRWNDPFGTHVLDLIG